LPFLHRVSFQPFIRRERGHRPGIMSDLLTLRDHLRRSRLAGVAAGAQDVRVETSARVWVCMPLVRMDRPITTGRRCRVHVQSSVDPGASERRRQLVRPCRRSGLRRRWRKPRELRGPRRSRCHSKVCPLAATVPCRLSGRDPLRRRRSALSATPNSRVPARPRGGNREGQQQRQFSLTAAVGGLVRPSLR
jgi:hypothetical protein